MKLTYDTIFYPLRNNIFASKEFNYVANPPSPNAFIRVDLHLDSMLKRKERRKEIITGKLNEINLEDINE